MRCGSTNEPGRTRSSRSGFRWRIGGRTLPRGAAPRNLAVVASAPQPDRMSVGPLDDDDIDDLRTALAAQGVDCVDVERSSIPSRRLGDPAAAVLVVALTNAAIAGLTAFLLKHRQRGTVRYSLQVEFADGTMLRESLDLETSDSSPPDAEVIKRLSELMRVSPRELPRETE